MLNHNFSYGNIVTSDPQHTHVLSHSAGEVLYFCTEGFRNWKLKAFTEYLLVAVLYAWENENARDSCPSCRAEDALLPSLQWLMLPASLSTMNGSLQYSKGTT